MTVYGDFALTEKDYKNRVIALLKSKPYTNKLRLSYEEE
jgi:hypothetical protein